MQNLGILFAEQRPTRFKAESLHQSVCRVNDMKHIQLTHGGDLPNSNFPEVLEILGVSIHGLRRCHSASKPTPIWGCKLE